MRLCSLCLVSLVLLTGCQRDDTPTQANRQVNPAQDAQKDAQVPPSERSSSADAVVEDASIELRQAIEKGKAIVERIQTIRKKFEHRLDRTGNRGDKGSVPAPAPPPSSPTTGEPTMSDPVGRRDDDRSAEHAPRVTTNSRCTFLGHSRSRQFNRLLLGAKGRG